MIESGCKYCPVTHCCASYRGSECSVQRAKYGLGDPKTNADRIRAMSDDELAKFLNEPFCDKMRTYEECTISYCGVCDQCVLDWLQQPAEAAQDSHTTPRTCDNCARDHAHDLSCKDCVTSYDNPPSMWLRRR